MKKTFLFYLAGFTFVFSKLNANTAKITGHDFDSHLKTLSAWINLDQAEEEEAILLFISFFQKMSKEILDSHHLKSEHRMTQIHNQIILQIMKKHGFKSNPPDIGLRIIQKIVEKGVFDQTEDQTSLKSHGKTSTDPAPLTYLGPKVPSDLHHIIKTSLSDFFEDLFLLYKDHPSISTLFRGDLINFYLIFSSFARESLLKNPNLEKQNKIFITLMFIFCLTIKDVLKERPEKNKNMFYNIFYEVTISGNTYFFRRKSN
jgi:hypothetical protein